MIKEFIGAIPAAAVSPLALVAYLAALAAWTFIAYRVKRLAVVMKDIEKFPEDDRKAIVIEEFRNARIPPELSAKQYLEEQRQLFVFRGFLALCATLVIVIGMSGYYAYDKRGRADGIIGEILDRPESQFMSSVNVLANGTEMVSDASVDSGPDPSNSDLSEMVDRMRRRGMNDAASIAKQLGRESSGGRIQQVSRSVNAAASNIDEAFSRLARCYRERLCANGSRKQEMCSLVARLALNMNSINEAARRIPGVMLNSSGGAPIFGKGTMDRYFDAVSMPNVEYLNAAVCS